VSALPPTESRHEREAQLDLLATGELVALLVDDQSAAVAAVRAAVPAIERAVDAIAARLRAGGRLHYAGAGTSGRLGALDAAEMPPTFGTAPELVRAHLAGGEAALLRAVEGAEDDAAAGARAIGDAVRAGDALVGVSASGGAAFVIAAIETARAAGALTVAIVNAGDSPLARAAEIAIVLETGAEVLAGSTRLKAGTAQKIALNTLSTAVMVRLEKVYGDRMVDVVATNRKLRARALRLVCELTQLDPEQAQRSLDASGGSVKVAVVSARCGIDAAAARAVLERSGGSLRAAIAAR
jgi:N-acetylmuramic acid 6-phosphate etherase